METINAKFTKAVYSNGDYSINLYLVIDEGKKKFVTCKGNKLPTAKVFCKMTGEYDGKDFNVSEVEMPAATSRAALIGYFSSDEYLGIGKKVIKAMVDKYGERIYKIIEENPEALFDIKGMTPDKLAILKKGYRATNSMKELTKLLAPVGISAHQLLLINNELGAEAIEVIQHNPFDLMDIKGVGFKTCDSIARYLEISLNSSERVKGGVLETLNENLSTGSTYADAMTLINATVKKLNDGLEKSAVTKKNVVDSMVELVKSKDIVVEEHNKVFSYTYWEAEESTAKKLNAMLRLPLYKKDEMLAALNKYTACRLSKGQMAAVQRSLTNRVSVITGGAGTGKTTIEKAIIFAYKQACRGGVTLLAPTGKASRRMSEATGIVAHTIHSRLGLYEGVETATNTIDSGLVIVDEFSMVDTLLFNYLIQAIHAQCQVVLIGDINQLSSVGAGACLKDMIESGVVPTSKLTEIFRQEGGTIVDNSLKIVAKDTSLVYDKDMIFASAPNEDIAIERIKKAYMYYADKLGVENVALIAPLRSTQNGRLKCVSDELNNIIQAEVNPSGASFSNGSCRFRVNDRVMMWKNTEQASNGDVGTVTDLTLENDDWGFEMTVDWENGNTAVYHKNDLDKLTLAYSMSVHKSQGSEYDTVIVPLLASQKCRLFKNNLLYTAVTRAKKRVVFIGDKDAVNYMVMHSETNARNTLFKEKLQKYKENREI